MEGERRCQPRPITVGLRALNHPMHRNHTKKRITARIQHKVQQKVQGNGCCVKIAHALSGTPKGGSLGQILLDKMYMPGNDSPETIAIANTDNRVQSSSFFDVEIQRVDCPYIAY